MFKETRNTIFFLAIMSAVHMDSFGCSTRLKAARAWQGLKLKMAQTPSAFGAESVRVFSTQAPRSNFNVAYRRNAVLGATGLMSTLFVSSYSRQPDAVGKEISGKPGHPLTIFAHGLGGNMNQGKHYQVAGSGFVEGPLRCFDFDDAFSPATSSLGQERDYSRLHAEIQLNPQGVILCGVSRGGATILNELGVNHPKNVVAAVVESPFDSVRSVSDNVIGRAGWIPGAGWIVHKLLPYVFYSGYNPNGVQPIDVVDKISQDIPILIVCSKQDKLIHYSSSVNLYRKLVSSGHKKTYLLVTEHGEHANILQGRDREQYRNIVHAFYREHNLAHNAAWADAGCEKFKTCQPVLNT